MALAKPQRRVRPVSPLELIRRKRGLSQAALAREIGMSRQYVGLIEGGLYPPPHLREAIAVVLGMNPEDLWPTPDNDSPPAERPGAGTPSARQGRDATR
jgi:transcriptional regulator with XRE-family HTH domain